MDSKINNISLTEKCLMLLLAVSIAVVLPYSVLSLPLSYDELDALRWSVVLGGQSYEFFSSIVHDRWSWSSAGQVVPNIHWLADEILYLVSSRLLASLMVVGAAIQVLHGILLVVGLLGVAVLVKAERWNELSLLSAMVCYALLSPTIAVWGSHLWTFALIPWGLAALRLSTRRGLIWTAILALLWVQLDIGFLLFGVTALLLFVAGFFEGKDEANFKLFKCLIVVGAVFFHPLRTSYWSALSEILSGENTLLSQQFGWISPNFHDYPQLAFGSAALLALLLLGRKQLSPSWTLLALGGVVCMLLGEGFPYLFALATSFVVAKFLHEFLGQRAALQVNLTKRWAALLVLVGLMSVFVTVLSRPQSSKLEGVVVFLHEPLQVVKQALKKRGAELRLIHDIRFGGELVQFGEKTFIDSRVLFFSKRNTELTVGGSIVRDYVSLMYMESQWKEVLQKWKFNAAIVYEDSILAAILREREGWREVARSPERYKQKYGRLINQTAVLLVSQVNTKERDATLIPPELNPLEELLIFD